MVQNRSEESIREEVHQNLIGIAQTMKGDLPEITRGYEYASLLAYSRWIARNIGVYAMAYEKLKAMEAQEHLSHLFATRAPGRITQAEVNKYLKDLPPS